MKNQRSFKDGYLFSALSTFFVCALIVCVLFSGQYYRQSLAHSGLIEMLSSSELRERDGERYIDVLIDYPSAIQFIDQLFVRKNTLPAQVLRGYYEILVHIKLKRYEEALQRAQSLREYVSLNEYEQPGAEAYDQIISTMESEYYAFNLSKDKFISIERSLQENVAAQRILSQDFAELLSLNPELPEDTSKLPEYYSGGVLSGLPKLSLLPDDIADLPALKNTMEPLGGTVKLKGDDIHAQFQNRLDQLRAEGKKLIAERQTLQSELAESRSLTNQQEKKFSQDASELSELVLKFIESMSKPRLF